MVCSVITGASRGIGKGIAEAYLDEGARVFLTARGEERLGRTAEELSVRGEVHYAAGDVADPDDAARIAAAVVVELNAGTFSQSFTAARAYSPEFELPDMETLQVTVVPKGVTTQPGSRSHRQHDYSVDVAVQQKLQTADDTEIDALMTLAEEVGDHFRFQRLPSFPNAMWLKTENDPVYAQEHIRELRQFTSILTVTFRVAR